MNSEQSEFFDEPKQDGPSRPTAKGVGGYQPLAARMRPRSLNEIVGQDHILGEDSLLRRLVSTDTLGSIVLYGPPGCGKTSIAEAIAQETGSKFIRINAVLSNTAELREILRWARSRPEDRTILFIDEIHRFNKAQQDLLLPDVESGAIRLIGATTHNPGFYVNPPLLSRSHLFKLQPVEPMAIVAVLKKALTDDHRGLGAREVEAEQAVLVQLAKISDGDLRRALTALETIVLGLPLKAKFTSAALEVYTKERHIRYDADEDEHYDTISAYIKSMRGGDPDASIYWLTKMLEGGEDPRFIARRLIIFASEDIGLADSRALPLATATLQACDFVGLPECQLNLAHCTLFMATSPKSNSSTLALAAARKSIKEDGLQAVPQHLRDGHTQFNQSIGQGKAYLYSHDFPEAISGQNFLEKPQTFYHPKSAGAEERIAERLNHWKSLRR